MKERPILFSAPMVKALLEGRKTQTRRIVKPQPPAWASEISDIIPPLARFKHTSFAPAHFSVVCPYGKPGDRLWVREAFCAFDIDRVHYRADFAPDKEKPSVWKPSLFMPRWASRITLEITDVRVQRVEDISDSDAFAEGIQSVINTGPTHGDGTARGEFLRLFYDINKRAKRGENPWVWVLEFKGAKA